MPELKTVDIEGVEIAKVGEWLGTDGRGRPMKVKFTREHFDAAIAAEKAARESADDDSAGDQPVKLGHEMLQSIFGAAASELKDGAPAFGWARNLRRQGDTLLADLRKVPEQLAELMKAGAYRRRSLEGAFNYPIGGKRYPFVFTGLSLLGATPPAVEGLKDAYRFSVPEAPEGAQLFLVTCAVAPEPDLTEEALDKLISKLRSFFSEEVEPFIAKRPGAPALRGLAGVWEQALRRAARITQQETQMRSAVAALLGQTEDADNAALAAALSKADEPAREGLIRLALNADAALAVIAEILGVPGSSPDEIVGKVRELSGGEPVPEEGISEMPEPTTGLSKPNGHDARFQELERQVAEAKTEAAQAMVRLARRDAEARADRDIAERSLPATIRETLVTLAARGDEDLYASVVATSKTVPTSERGTSGGTDTAALEPTDSELAVFLSAGMSKDEARATLRAHKADMLGLELPVEAK